METQEVLVHVGYLVSISMFILGIRRLSKVKTARSANALAAGAMLLATACALVELGTVDYTFIIAGLVIGSLVGVVLAYTVEMTAMPQLVAVFNGFGGGASALVGLSVYTAATKSGPLAVMEMQGGSGLGTALTLVFSILIGTLTFSGSILAYLKLSEKFGRQFGKPIMLPMRHLLNLGLLASIIGCATLWLSYVSSPYLSGLLAVVLTIAALVLGVTVVLPIGGADMPVVISLLNSYSGLAASATGFALGANVLIVSGALVGASGLILTMIMCKGMNRSLLNVMAGGFGEVATGGGNNEYTNVRSCDAEEAALDFEAARNVIIVPGYGLAVAQGQGAVAEFASQLKELGCKVRYAIHPVAGRMPGHMNVLLAESNIPYEDLFEMDEINNEFKEADIALVVGANDVVNPSAKDDKDSPLYGMPVLNVEQSSIVFVIKRSLSPGFAGVKNELFEYDNCRMIFGDAKKVLEELTSHVAVDMAA